MAHKCFISFKTEDHGYKKYIQDYLDIDMIDKSVNVPVDSDDEDQIMRVIRENYLSDSTVTLFLIGSHSAENSMFQDQYFIKRELQASLYNGVGNSKSGILGIVLPSMYASIYGGQITCATCRQPHNVLMISENTVIKEFAYNYFIPHNKCFWSEDERYCVLVRWDDFVLDAEKYIDMAYDKRSAPISSKTKVRP